MIFDRISIQSDIFTVTQKKNATQRRRSSYYSGWRTRLERKSHFYFWSLWRWVDGAHVSLTTPIHWLQTFNGPADKLFIVALQRQCHEGDLVGEGKAACLLAPWAEGTPASSPIAPASWTSQLVLRTERATCMRGSCQHPRTCNGMHAARGSSKGPLPTSASLWFGEQVNWERGESPRYEGCVAHSCML